MRITIKNKIKKKKRSKYIYTYIMSTGEPIIKFSNEESKANIRNKIAQNLLNLIELTNSTVKSSESRELFRSCFKSFVANDQTIENSCDKFQKIEIISNQLNYQVDSITSDLNTLGEISKQIDSIQKKTKHYNKQQQNE